MGAKSLTDKLLSEQRVIITGGSGFIGSRLALRLADDGATVLAVDRLTGKHDEISAESKFDRAILDLSDLASVIDCIQSFCPDTIIHLACAPDAAEDSNQLRKSIDGNLRLTVNVLDAFREFGAGLFILGDSSKVYGNSIVPYHSGLVPDPISSYAIGKCAAWNYCRYFERLYGMKVVSVRPSLIYGPDQAFNIMTHAMTCVLRSDPVIRLSGGHQTRDPLFIDDALDAYVAVVSNGCRLSGKIVNIGGGHEITIFDLVERIVRLMDGNSRVEADPSSLRATEILRSYCDNAEAFDWLGWRPAVDLDTGLRRMIDSFRRSSAS